MKREDVDYSGGDDQKGSSMNPSKEARALVNGHFGMVEKAHNGERLVERLAALLERIAGEARGEALREAHRALMELPVVGIATVPYLRALTACREVVRKLIDGSSSSPGGEVGEQSFDTPGVPATVPQGAGTGGEKPLFDARLLAHGILPVLASCTRTFRETAGAHHSEYCDAVSSAFRRAYDTGRLAPAGSGTAEAAPTPEPGTCGTCGGRGFWAVTADGHGALPRGAANGYETCPDCKPIDPRGPGIVGSHWIEPSEAAKARPRNAVTSSAPPPEAAPTVERRVPAKRDEWRDGAFLWILTGESRSSDGALEAWTTNGVSRTWKWFPRERFTDGTLHFVRPAPETPGSEGGK